MKNITGKVIYASLLLVSLCGGFMFGESTVVNAQSSEANINGVDINMNKMSQNNESKAEADRKEKFKQNTNIDKYKLVDKKDLGVRKGYDPEHPEEDWALGDSFGQPTGTNTIAFTNFAPGDIILVHDGPVAWGHYRHAAVWDGKYYNGTLDSYAFIEANVENNKGDSQKNVHYSAARKFRGYDKAVGLYVHTLEQQFRTKARDYVMKQVGKPYKLVGSAPHDTSTWYCSKLPWKAYVEVGNRDIDANGGTYIYPDDIYEDSDTKVFVSAS